MIVLNIIAWTTLIFLIATSLILMIVKKDISDRIVNLICALIYIATLIAYIYK